MQKLLLTSNKLPSPKLDAKSEQIYHYFRSIISNKCTDADAKLVTVVKIKKR